MLSKKKVISILVLVFLTMAVFAQEVSDSNVTQATIENQQATNPEITKKVVTDPYKEYPIAIGLYGQLVPSIQLCGGLHFQGWFDRLGLQLSFGGIASDEDLNYSIIGSTMFSLIKNYLSEGFTSNLYLWLEFGHHGYKDFNDILLFNEILGLGVGVDVVILDHFSIPLEFGYAVEFPQKFELGFCISSGFRYRF